MQSDSSLSYLFQIEWCFCKADSKAGTPCNAQTREDLHRNIYERPFAKDPEAQSPATNEVSWWNGQQPSQSDPLTDAQNPELDQIWWEAPEESQSMAEPQWITDQSQNHPVDPDPNLQSQDPATNEVSWSMRRQPPQNENQMVLTKHQAPNPSHEQTLTLEETAMNQDLAWELYGIPSAVEPAQTQPGEKGPMIEVRGPAVLPGSRPQEPPSMRDTSGPMIEVRGHAVHPGSQQQPSGPMLEVRGPAIHSDSEHQGPSSIHDSSGPMIGVRGSAMHPESRPPRPSPPSHGPAPQGHLSPHHSSRAPYGPSMVPGSPSEPASSPALPWTMYSRKPTGPIQYPESRPSGPMIEVRGPARTPERDQPSHGPNNPASSNHPGSYNPARAAFNAFKASSSPSSRMPASYGPPAHPSNNYPDPYSMPEPRQVRPGDAKSGGTPEEPQVLDEDAKRGPRRRGQVRRRGPQRHRPQAQRRPTPKHQGPPKRRGSQKPRRGPSKSHQNTQQLHNDLLKTLHGQPAHGVPQTHQHTHRAPQTHHAPQAHHAPPTHHAPPPAHHAPPPAHHAPPARHVPPVHHAPPVPRRPAVHHTASAVHGAPATPHLPLNTPVHGLITPTAPRHITPKPHQHVPPRAHPKKSLVSIHPLHRQPHPNAITKQRSPYTVPARPPHPTPLKAPHPLPPRIPPPNPHRHGPPRLHHNAIGTPKQRSPYTVPAKPPHPTPVRAPQHFSPKMSPPVLPPHHHNAIGTPEQRSPYTVPAGRMFTAHPNAIRTLSTRHPKLPPSPKRLPGPPNAKPFHGLIKKAPPASHVHPKAFQEMLKAPPPPKNHPGAAKQFHGLITKAPVHPQTVSLHPSNVHPGKSLRLSPGPKPIPGGNQVLLRPGSAKSGNGKNFIAMLIMCNYFTVPKLELPLSA